MANPEHLKILNNGVKEWNKWMLYNDEQIPDLRGASLYGVNLNRANLDGVDLSNAELVGASLHGASLNQADLTHAKMSCAELSRADLSEADLECADLTSTVMFYTNLKSAKLAGADVSHSHFCGTLLADVDISAVIGLEQVRHNGPSSIGLDTFFRSKGKISEIFLRDAGVPDIFIEYAHSLAGTPFEFYSCFISYSTKDEEFAKRLHADLQSKGVRCWFAPEDLKTGEKFRVKIDEAIRIYDKLLIVLSEHSVQSEWVEKEVETAFEKERRDKRLVLFPIRLDDAVMEVEAGWAADIRRTRHIGDFRNWKDHDAYTKSFDRLMRDLKSGKAKPD